eukprot:TRINITY_DN31197_c0_g1_i1.p1 TRINITY_DN31197_c0_g1~~TRINITY_DN31197_c0_g1_i1.p1  ORF type:complete len:426 (+),score=109.45 TRINITY_DN31197_c0_g1_i1:46-1278(+)
MEAAAMLFAATGAGIAGGAAAAVAGAVAADASEEAASAMCSAPDPNGVDCVTRVVDGAPLAACVGASLGAVGAGAASASAGCTLPSIFCMAGIGAAGAASGVATTVGVGRTTIMVRNRQTGLLTRERVPNYVRVALRLMYGCGGGTLAESVKDMLRERTLAAERRYEGPDSVGEIEPFVRQYGIDTEEADPSDLSVYRSFNEFFARRLRSGARPIASGDVLVSPADARTLAFRNVDAAKRIWVKGTGFTIPALVGDQGVAGELGHAPAVLLSRLAPQDYHRFHTPCRGVVKRVQKIEGEYYTVNPVAVRSKVDVLTENTRVVFVLDTVRFGSIAVVAVGATIVGSVRSSVEEGDTVEAGGELGAFAFGGSTVVTLLRSDKVLFDSDLLESSGAPVETLLRQGERVGGRTH